MHINISSLIDPRKGIILILGRNTFREAVPEWQNQDGGFGALQPPESN
jgi:hypothetical protein